MVSAAAHIQRRVSAEADDASIPATRGNRAPRPRPPPRPTDRFLPHGGPPQSHRAGASATPRTRHHRESPEGLAALPALLAPTPPTARVSPPPARNRAGAKMFPSPLVSETPSGRELACPHPRPPRRRCTGKDRDARPALWLPALRPSRSEARTTPAQSVDSRQARTPPGL